MKRLTFTSLITALFLLSAAQGVEAQNRRGMGGILDWISKLSGPPMLSAGLTGFHALGGEGSDWRVRGAATIGTSIAEEGSVTPDDGKVRMFTLQPMLERHTKEGRVALGVGPAFHLFWGGDGTDKFDTFMHLSIAADVSLRPWLANSNRFLKGLFINPGVDFFLKFDDSDFLPLVVDVSRDDPELVMTLAIGWELIP